MRRPDRVWPVHLVACILLGMADSHPNRIVARGSITSVIVTAGVQGRNAGAQESCRTRKTPAVARALL